jgi:hypothetical protein
MKIPYYQCKECGTSYQTSEEMHDHLFDYHCDYVDTAGDDE